MARLLTHLQDAGLSNESSPPTHPARNAPLSRRNITSYLGPGAAGRRPGSQKASPGVQMMSHDFSSAAEPGAGGSRSELSRARFEKEG